MQETPGPATASTCILGGYFRPEDALSQISGLLFEPLRCANSEYLFIPQLRVAFFPPTPFFSLLLGIQALSWKLQGSQFHSNSSIFGTLSRFRGSSVVTTALWEDAEEDSAAWWYVCLCNISPPGMLQTGWGWGGSVPGQGAALAVNRSALCSTSISVRRKAGFRVVSEKQTAGFTDRTLI